MNHHHAARHLLLAACCLLLGAATTIGVAWGLELERPYYREFGSRVERWPWPVPTEWGWSSADIQARPDHAFTALGPGRAKTSAALRDAQDSRGLRLGMDVRLLGWPRLALASVRELGDLDDASGNWRFAYRQGFARSNSKLQDDSSQCLPVMPVWPGFAADTALYAVVWWPLIVAPLLLYRTARRRSRISRGLCPACAYDLNASPPGPCPECGHVPGAKA